MKARNIFIPVIALGFIAAYFACTTVEPYQEAVIFTASGPKILSPGFYVNVPFSKPVQKMDMRIQTYTVSDIPITTQDRSNILLDIAVLWKVQNDMTYAKVCNADAAQVNNWLNQAVTQLVQQSVRKQGLAQILAASSDALAQSLNNSLAAGAAQRGIQIVDINLQNVSYAPAMLNRVYQNMEASVQDQVKQINAAGQQQAAEITAQGKTTAEAVINEAYIQAATVKGQAEAKAQLIYNQAYSKDPQFYAFWRSMQLYQELFTSKNTVLVVKPQGQFLQYLNSYKP